MHSLQNRNVGILVGFLLAFFMAYIISAEYAKPPKSKGEVLVFRRGKMPGNFKKNRSDVEAQSQQRAAVAEKSNDKGSSGLTASASVFHWEDLCYDIQIKGNERRLLDNVDGWVKPGLSTALMVWSPQRLSASLAHISFRVSLVLERQHY